MAESDFSRELARLEHDKTQGQYRASQLAAENQTEAANIAQCRRIGTGTSIGAMFEPAAATMLNSFGNEAESRGYRGAVDVKFGKLISPNSWRGRAYVIGALCIAGGNDNALVWCEDRRLRASESWTVEDGSTRSGRRTITYGTVPDTATFTPGVFTYEYQNTDSRLRTRTFHPGSLATVLASKLI